MFYSNQYKNIGLRPNPGSMLLHLASVVIYLLGLRYMDWIYWVKLVHTVIFFFASACIMYVVYCGVVGKINSYLWASIGIVFIIGLIYAVNGFECPLSTLVHRLAGRRDVSDIYFPDWFARNIMPVSTVIYIVGVALVARHLYRDMSRE